MSRIRNNLLGGSNIPKAPSKRDVEAMIKKRKEDEKELIEKMNIPPRDVEKYPMPDETDMKNSAAFIYNNASNYVPTKDCYALPTYNSKMKDSDIPASDSQNSQLFPDF